MSTKNSLLLLATRWNGQNFPGGSFPVWKCLNCDLIYTEVPSWGSTDNYNAMAETPTFLMLHREYQRLPHVTEIITYEKCFPCTKVISEVFSCMEIRSKNTWSRSRTWSNFKFTSWVQHPIDSHPFRSMSISPPITEMQLFQYSLWKSKVKVMSVINEGRGHIVSPVSNQFTSFNHASLFHINKTTQSGNTAI